MRDIVLSELESRNTLEGYNISQLVNLIAR